MAETVSVDVGRGVDDRCPVEFGNFDLFLSGTFVTLLDRLVIGPVDRLAILLLREL